MVILYILSTTPTVVVCASQVNSSEIYSEKNPVEQWNLKDSSDRMGLKSIQ